MSLRTVDGPIRGAGRHDRLAYPALLALGANNTGSVGILLQSVSAERIVTAMVVWSQIGILGYLLGPLVGGAAAEGLGSAALGLVPLVGGAMLVVALLSQSRAPAPA